MIITLIYCLLTQKCSLEDCPIPAPLAKTIPETPAHQHNRVQGDPVSPRLHSQGSRTALFYGKAVFQTVLVTPPGSSVCTDLRRGDPGLRNSHGAGGSREGPVKQPAGSPGPDPTATTCGCHGGPTPFTPAQRPRSCPADGTG